MKKAFRVFFKDLQEHSGPYGLLASVIVGMLTILPLYQPNYLTARIQLEFVFNLNLITLMAIPHWLLAREKEKKTILILRTLPISARQMLLGKFLAAFAMSEGIYLASLVSSFFMLKFALHMEMVATPSRVVFLNLALLAFLSVVLASFTRFTPRIAVIVPFGCLLLLVLAWISIKKHLNSRGISIEPALTSLMNSSLFPLMAVLCFILVVVTAFRLSERYIEAHHAADLVL